MLTGRQRAGIARRAPEPRPGAPVIAVDQPILSETIRRFELDFNILHGQIDEIQGQAFGSLAVLAGGDPVNVAQALVYLRKAMDEGFKDRKRLIEDKDFAVLRTTPQFQKLLDQENLN